MSQHPLPIPGPLGLGDIIDRAIRLYRAHFRPLVLTALILLLPATVLTGVFSSLTTLGLADDSGLGLALGYFGLALLFVLAGLVLQGLASLALTQLGQAGLAGEPVSFAVGLRVALRRFPSWLGMSILQGLAYGGLLVVAIIPLSLAIAAATALNSSEEAALVGLLCGYGAFVLVFFVPLIYLAARWIVPLPALLVEGLGASPALRRSWQLTKGRVWRSIGYQLLLGILSLLIVSLPLFALQAGLVFLMPEATVAQSVISSAVSGLLSAFWTPLVLLAYLLYYYDLRVRAEGYDLSLRVSELEAEVRPEADVPFS